jgi:hypothetical protein
MSKYGFEKDKRLGKNEDGAPQTIPYVISTSIRKGVGKTQGTSHVKFVKGGTTCDEGAKIVASSLKQDKFQTSKIQESSYQMSFFDYMLTRNHHGKVVAMSVGHRS